MSYRAFEFSTACVSGWASLTRTTTTIQQVKALQTVGKWVIVNKMVTYDFVIEGGVSAVNAAGVAVVETFSVIINAISLTSTPGGVDNPDVGGATE